VLAQRARALPIALSAALLGVNWLVFIFAVADRPRHRHEPRLLRRTRSSRSRSASPCSASGCGPRSGSPSRSRRRASLWWTARLGGLPWISAALAVSFALYGLVRKLVPISSLLGFALEMLFLAPLAAVFLVARPPADRSRCRARVRASPRWLAASGVVTAAPLVFFASATRRLPLIAIGLFQYSRRASRCCSRCSGSASRSRATTRSRSASCGRARDLHPRRAALDARAFAATHTVRDR
jgi:chloramphenicol-sensitive protein RarD